MDVKRSQVWDEKSGSYFADSCEYAGRTWIAPLGTPLDPDGLTPGLGWVAQARVTVASPN